MEYFENERVKMKYDDGLLFAEIKLDKPSLSLEDAKLLVKDRIEFTKGEIHLMCAQVTRIYYADAEVREYMSSEEGKRNIAAGALVTSSAVSKVFFNFFIKVSKLDKVMPVKFFTSEKAAMDWMMKMKKKLLVPVMVENMSGN